MVYSQSIEESKLSRMSINIKSNGSKYQGKSRFRKRDKTQGEPSSANVKFEKGGGSQNAKPTCAACGKRYYGECLRGTLSCYVCGKEVHRVRYCHHIASKGKEGKQVTPSVPKEDVPKEKAHFFALRPRGSKSDANDDDDECKSMLLSLFSYMSSLLVGDFV